MKKLEQIQEENRKAIIMANNPEAKSYNEALEMELGFGCEIKVNNIRKTNDHKIILDTDYNSSGKCWNFVTRNYEDGLKFRDVRRVEIKTIIGKPLTLDRVLIALESKDNYWNGYGYSFGHIGIFCPEGGGGNLICYWDLKKPTLEEQSEETQREVNKLLIK